LCQVPSQSFLCGRWKPFSAIMYQYCAKIYFVCTLPFAQFSAVILKTNVIGTILKWTHFRETANLKFFCLGKTYCLTLTGTDFSRKFTLCDFSLCHLVLDSNREQAS
jgi:hypothetical protein